MGPAWVLLTEFLAVLARAGPHGIIRAELVELSRLMLCVGKV